jgi:hypothetical protein
MKNLKFLILLTAVVLLTGCFLANKDQHNQQHIVKEQSEIDGFKVISTSEDSVVFDKLFLELDVEDLRNKQLSEIIVSVALYLQDAPYVAHTLELYDEECLVVNLREFDCTTFVENVLAISYLIKSENPSFGRFVDFLRVLRYRDGIIDRYPSRLHYFTDWLYDNEQKGIVHLVSNDFGDADFDASVNFMSENFSLYPALERDSVFVEEIRSVEKRVSDIKFKKVSPANISHIIDSVNSGDIVAFSTNIDGLDIAHLGFAYLREGKLRFIHASTNGNRVRISEKTLEEYVKDIKNMDGVLFARPKNDFLLN